MDDPDKRILLVEDDREIRALVCELLESEGYRVACVADGLAALVHLQEATKLPHLILLDLMMPSYDGYQFRARQLRDERIKGIPVLIMTASGDLPARVAELKAEGCLKKPFEDPEVILSSVARFF